MTTINAPTRHDEIRSPIATAAYDFVDAPHILDHAAIVPKRPHAGGMSLPGLCHAEEGHLSANGAKKVSRETRLGIHSGTLPRGNYRATIALNKPMHKFFGRDGFQVTDVFVKNSPLNGHNYKDAEGKLTRVHSAVTSSFNRLADTITLLRKVEAGDGTSHYYAGRVDRKGPTSTAKAEEAAKMIFLSELETGRKGLTETGPNRYTLQLAVQSVLGSSRLPSLSVEQDALLDEIKAYEELAEKTKKEPLQITHPETGKTFSVQVLSVPVAQTQFNWVNQLSLLNDSWISGELVAKELSGKADAALFAKVEQAIAHSPSEETSETASLLTPTLSDDQKRLKDTAALLKKGELKPWEEVLVRAYLCHLLNLPLMLHCKSSVDRTNLAGAMISSMEQWIQSGREIPQDTDGNYNILKIVGERVVETDGSIVYPFKELYACNLRKGLIESELSRGQRGLKFNRGWSQSLALQDLVPSRYLKPYNAKDLLVRLTIRIASFILGLLAIIFTLGGILKAIRMKSLKGFDVWLAPFKAFNPAVFPEKLVDETTAFGKELIFSHTKSQPKLGRLPPKHKN